MTESVSNAEQVAAGLTEAQRGAILNAAPGATPKPLFVPVYRDMGRLAASLRDLGLAKVHARGTALTRLGLAVREILRREA